MPKRRWNIGGYETKYNPKSDSRTIKETSGPVVSVNGVVSNSNDFYNKDIALEIDLYDKPTKIMGQLGPSFSSGYYISLAEKRVTEEIFCLRGIFVDVIHKGTGILVRSFLVDQADGGIGKGICHMDDRIGVFYDNGTLVIYSELGAVISKYNYIDTDIMKVESIAFMYGTNIIYGLNSFGKIFSFSTVNGDSNYIYEFSDFIHNTANGIRKYNGIHCVNEFVGFYSGAQLSYFNPQFDIVYSTNLPSSALDVAYGVWSEDLYVLTQNKILIAQVNLCGLDIDKIKRIISNGIIPVTDENRATFYVIVKGMEVDRRRNLQDSRYEISIRGSLM